jgi:hypothetical protein
MDLTHADRAWKFRYSAACLSILVHLAVSTRISQYSEVLELDDQIRRFPVPSHLQIPTDTDRVLWSADPFRAMEQYGVVCVKESSEHTFKCISFSAWRLRIVRSFVPAQKLLCTGISRPIIRSFAAPIRAIRSSCPPKCLQVVSSSTEPIRRASETN